MLAEELKPRAGGHGVTLGGGRLRPGPRWGGVWHLPAVDRRKWEAESWPLSLGASAFGRPGECALPMFPLPPARGTSLSRGCDKPSTESEPVCAGQAWPFPARLQRRPATRSFRFGVLHQRDLSALPMGAKRMCSLLLRVSFKQLRRLGPPFPSPPQGRPHPAHAPCSGVTPRHPAGAGGGRPRRRPGQSRP